MKNLQKYKFFQFYDVRRRKSSTTWHFTSQKNMKTEKNFQKMLPFCFQDVEWECILKCHFSVQKTRKIEGKKTLKKVNFFVFKVPNQEKSFKI